MRLRDGQTNAYSNPKLKTREYDAVPADDFALAEMLKARVEHYLRCPGARSCTLNSSE